MRNAILVAALLVAGLGLAGAAAADSEPEATCTLSYPGTCWVEAGDAAVACSGVGAVPDCRVR